MIVPNAATRYVRNRIGSLSSFSSARQAKGVLDPAFEARHSLMSVVFPKPAGADISVSGEVSPWFRCAMRWGRGTSVGRGGGKKSFVERSCRFRFLSKLASGIKL